MSLITETSLVRVRQKASRLLLPTLVLAAGSFSLSFIADLLSPEHYEIALWVIGVVVGVFWLIPFLSYLAGYLEITNQRLIYRHGLFGLRKKTMHFKELSSIEIQRPRALGGKVISLLGVDGQELVLSGYARTKLLAAEIEAQASKSL
jgi:hypothetical protein